MRIWQLFTGRLYTPVATVLVMLLFVLGNLTLQPALKGVRGDFTENKLYTLSPGTRGILADLAEPIDLTFVYTRRVGQEYPNVRAYAARVRELLETYDSLGGGQLRLREIDPMPFSPEEDEALAAGLTAVQTDGTDPLYFGLIGRNAVDDELVIPFLAPEREVSLEYDLTRMVTRLDKPVPATVGILSDLAGMKGNGREDGYFILQEIAKAYEVEPIPTDFVAIPSSVDILLIAHPAPLTERQTYLIDQFLVSRGRALIFLDPASKAGYAGAPFGEAAAKARSDLSGLLPNGLGVGVSQDAVADVAHALPVIVDAGNGRATQVGQPLFIAVPRTGLAEDELITASLSRAIHFGAPGALRPTGERGDLTMSALIQTGEAPSFIPAQSAAGDMSPQDVVANYTPQEAPLILAARLTGDLVSSFPGGAVVPDETGDPVRDELAAIAADDAPPHEERSASPVEIILVADTDILDDGFYVDPGTGAAVGDNAAFVLNALDHLSGGADLVSLRSRAGSLRPMTRIQNMRLAAEALYFNEQAALEAELTETQARLEELQAIGATGGFYSGDLNADLSPEERTELIALREVVVDTRARLRGIERDFRRDIDALETRLTLVNIWLAPLIVGLIGLFMSARRRGSL